MLLSMGVSLYTSRIVLNTLGVIDFGIYNVVGGVVLMFSFLNSSMASATQRFLSYELGKEDYEQLKKVFSMSINIHAIIAVSVFILAETIGLWFLNSQLIIPVERLEAANWVYQFSVLSFMVTIMSVPYNSAIIAHERMNVYAFVSILEVILKLAIVIALVWVGYDKLKLYSIFVFSVTVILWIIYKQYTKLNFKETNYRFFWDKSLYKILMNYAGWNIFGNLAVVAMGQGVNILLNIFFGPVVNASRAIAYQVNSAVNGFVSNFQMSLNPQIVKSYASNDHIYMHQLIYRGSKYSFFLLFFLSLPVLLQTETLLRWWLKIVPDFAVLFCQLVLIDTLITCISGPLMTAAQATGKIKLYQALVGGLLLLNLPLSYIFLKLGYEPQITFFIAIGLSILALFARLVMLRTLMSFSARIFIKKVVFKVFIVTILSVLVPLFVIPFLENETTKFLVITSLSFLSVMTMIYLTGLEKDERIFIKARLIILAEKLKR